MYIKKLELHNFRNYEDLSVEFDPRVNLIVGENAQGKTNLIEGVSLTSMGRSFRVSKDSEMIRFGETQAFVHAEAEKALTDTKVDIMIDRGSRKFIKKDGSRLSKMSELMNNIIIVSFSPEDLRIVKDEPGKRRRFLDREISQIDPAYFRNLASYKKSLQQRNNALKEDRIDQDMLAVWDEQLTKYGAEIIQSRQTFVDKISGFSAAVQDRITEGKEKMEVVYRPNIRFFADKKEQEEAIRESLENHREMDLRMRTTFAGPHKDDIEFFINGIDVRKFGSQGQQRTCALSLKLASLDFIREETGEEGILLLDDVMSELDAGRREFLIRALRNNQIFITTTDLDQSLRNAYKEARVLRVTAGTVRIEDTDGNALSEDGAAS